MKESLLSGGSERGRGLRLLLNNESFNVRPAAFHSLKKMMSCRKRKTWIVLSVGDPLRRLSYLDLSRLSHTMR